MALTLQEYLDLIPDQFAKTEAMIREVFKTGQQGKLTAARVEGWIAEMVTDSGAGSRAGLTGSELEDQLRDDIAQWVITTDVIMDFYGVDLETAEKLVLGGNEGGLNFSDLGATDVDQGGGVDTGIGVGADESPDQEKVGGVDEETVSILTSKDMQWHFDAATGKWMVSYKLPNSDRRIFFEASGSELDAIFGDGQRPVEFENISFGDLAKQEGVTFGGGIIEIHGEGSFEAEVEETIARALDEGVLPDWAKQDGEVMDIIFIAQSEGKSQDWVIDQISKLPSFKERFPGIEAFEGVGLNMVEAVTSFLELENGIKKLTVRDGGDPNTITPAMVGDLVKMGHSLTDVQFVYNTFDRLERNAGALAAFNDVLAARGMDPLTEDDQFSFMAGTAPDELYNIWEEASLHQAAIDAGLNLGVQGAIDLAAATEGLTSYGAALEGLNVAATNLLRFRNQLALGQYDLDEQDLIDLSVGIAPQSGRSQADIARNIDRAVRSAQASQAGRANPFVSFTEEGVAKAGSLARQRTESA